MFGTIKFFVMTKFSSKLVSALSNLGVVVANAFSNWPFATCTKKFRGSSILKLLSETCCFIWVFPLTFALQSTKASIVRIFPKCSCTQNISFLRFRTTVEISGRYSSLVGSSLSNPSSINGFVTVRGELFLPPLRVVVMC